MRSTVPISVAIATYNGERHIEQLLESILEQTVIPKEIVLSDDGSTDRTVELLERFCGTARVPVRLLRHSSNLGIIHNFMAAFRACSGDIVAYCDQDDVWKSDKLEDAYRKFRTNTTLVCHPSIICDADLKATGKIYYNIPWDYCIGQYGVASGIVPWGHQICFRRSVVDVLSELYTHRTFADGLIGRNFDIAIPFVASLLGDLYFCRSAKVLFRRHQNAVSDAGSIEAQSTSERPQRAGRLHRLEDTSDLVGEICATLNLCEFILGINLAASRRNYSSYSQLIKRRIEMMSKDNLGTRLRLLPACALSVLEDPRDPKGRVAEFAADILSALRGVNNVDALRGS